MTVMPAPSLQDARAAVVRERVLEGVADLLAAGDDLTFAKVAAAADVPERTVYRHFPTRQDLLTAVFESANERIGFAGGEPPSDGAATIELVRRAFPAFDEMAPIIHELLISPEGLPARLSDNDRRRRSALAVVRRDAPGLDRTSARRVAAAVQLLTAAAAWQTLRDYWDMDGAEAAETSALAIALVLEGARTRTTTGARRRAAHGTKEVRR
jgi:AcrR family transcriptional regulator